MSDPLPAMKVYLSRAPDGEIIIMARAEGPDGLIGDMVLSVRPGDPHYTELLALGSGERDWPPQRDD